MNRPDCLVVSCLSLSWMLRWMPRYLKLRVLVGEYRETRSGRLSEHVMPIVDCYRLDVSVN
jgi:hypothetical protein